MKIEEGFIDIDGYKETLEIVQYMTKATDEDITRLSKSLKLLNAYVGGELERIQPIIKENK